MESLKAFWAKVKAWFIGAEVKVKAEFEDLENKFENAKDKLENKYEDKKADTAVDAQISAQEDVADAKEDVAAAKMGTLDTPVVAAQIEEVKAEEKLAVANVKANVKAKSKK